MRRDAPHAASVGRFWGPRALPSLDITPSPPPPSRLCLRRDMVLFLHTAHEALEEQEREWAASECPKKARAAKVIRDCLEYHGDHDVVYIPFASRGKIRVLSELELENGSPSPLHPRPLCDTHTHTRARASRNSQKSRGRAFHMPARRVGVEGTARKVDESYATRGVA